MSLELANAWLVAHPAGAVPGAELPPPPIASLPPSDQNISLGEEVVPSDAVSPLQELSSAPAASPVSPPPAPASPAPASPPPAAPVPEPPAAPQIAVAPLPAPALSAPASPPPTATVPEPPPPELPVAVSALAGAALLQVGAFPTDALAGQAWQTFRAEHGEIVADLTSDIQEVDLGERGVWHRLRIGPFADRASANARCAVLQTRGADCFVATP